MKFPVLRSIVALAVASGAIGMRGQGTVDTPTDGSAAKSAPILVQGRPDYVLEPQDVIRIQVFQEDDINKQCDGLSVSQECTVTLPLIGTISVRDKTVHQAEEMIRSLYDRDYIVNPQVTLTVIKYAERTVNVMGSVTNQGRIQFPQERGLSIVDALSLAGGQTRLADLKHVRLTRRNTNGDPETSIIDVDGMTKKGGPDPVMLQPDDIVYVPERIL